MKLGSILVAGLVTLVPCAAMAAGDKQSPPPQDPDSTIAVELRFGPYRPNVDSEPGLSGTPYRDLFGDSTRYQIGLEVDWEAIHVQHVGSLSLGGAFGWTRSSGVAKITKTGLPSDEETTLWMMPFSALAVARFDVLARETAVPLVPYAKFGLTSAIWQATNGRGTAHADLDGSIGRGHTNGYTYALGAMFLLDFLEPQTAKTFRVEQGVNHTYLFGEWTVTKLEGLGQSHAMYLGDSTWNVGFAFEM